MICDAMSSQLGRPADGQGADRAATQKETRDTTHIDA
jgi:hypothetical protein